MGPERTSADVSPLNCQATRTDAESDCPPCSHESTKHCGHWNLSGGCCDCSWEIDSVFHGILGYRNKETNKTL